MASEGRLEINLITIAFLSLHSYQRLQSHLSQGARALLAKQPGMVGGAVQRHSRHQCKRAWCLALCLSNPSVRAFGYLPFRIWAGIPDTLSLCLIFLDFTLRFPRHIFYLSDLGPCEFNAPDRSFSSHYILVPSLPTALPLQLS